MADPFSLANPPIQLIDQPINEYPDNISGFPKNHKNFIKLIAFLLVFKQLCLKESNPIILEDTLTQQIEKLNKSEKLRLVEAIWDSIASEPGDVPLPEHHKSVLDERLKTLDEDTEKGVSWDKFRKKYL